MTQGEPIAGMLSNRGQGKPNVRWLQIQSGPSESHISTAVITGTKF